ncbi:hypothetical protein M409DRAFT_56057 [Zasmidium cellare ATCC 36951]|uniref:Uncharacterized protein n=1 Tax=Zasmidium cellare ATCC 36951 TaxID=1080233 RepID=A0A6A6CHK5_ZASCE|nr:uncharacterized protein M409DRAFT_56057 [Zasmidium cellare ATCC 36951]KAF2165179.1 hypothetical protein M409DRAFT_56057 [Zasmidium cellare ATCC 36951]
MEEEEDRPSSAQQQLNLWIHGHITTPTFTFFTTSPPFSLKDLHVALTRSVKEIALRLDPSLECMFVAARDPQHSVLLDESEFYEGRVLNVDELIHMEGGIESLSRERVVQLLDMCRDEIEWERHEIHRLETHCDIAERQKLLKIRDTFQYRPCPRRERTVVPGIGVITADQMRDSVRGESMDDSFEDSFEDGEIEDEEMLEAEKGDEGDAEDEKVVKVEGEGEDEKVAKVEDEVDEPWVKMEIEDDT